MGRVYVLPRAALALNNQICVLRAPPVSWPGSCRALLIVAEREEAPKACPHVCEVHLQPLQQLLDEGSDTRLRHPLEDGGRGAAAGRADPVSAPLERVRVALELAPLALLEVVLDHP